MSESSDKWGVFWRNLQALVAGLAALTAGSFVEVLGLTALAFIWLGLFAAVVTIYALRFRAELLSWDKIEHPIVGRLESEVAQAQGIAERLMLEKSELRRQLRLASGEEEIATLAEENVRLKSEVEYLRAREKEKEKLKAQLQQQLAEIGQVRKVGIYGGGQGRRRFKVWHRRTEVILGQAFGEDSSQLQSFLRIRFKGSALENRASVYQEALDEAEAILKVAIEEEL